MRGFVSPVRRVASGQDLPLTEMSVSLSSCALRCRKGRVRDPGRSPALLRITGSAQADLPPRLGRADAWREPVGRGGARRSAGLRRGLSTRLRHWRDSGVVPEMAGHLAGDPPGRMHWPRGTAKLARGTPRRRRCVAFSLVRDRVGAARPFCTRTRPERRSAARAAGSDRGLPSLLGRARQRRALEDAAADRSVLHRRCHGFQGQAGRRSGGRPGEAAQHRRADPLARLQRLQVAGRCEQPVVGRAGSRTGLSACARLQLLRCRGAGATAGCRESQSDQRRARRPHHPRREPLHAGRSRVLRRPARALHREPEGLAGWGSAPRARPCCRSSRPTGAAAD